MTNNATSLRALLTAPGVSVFMAGRFAGGLGIWIERIALGWLVWELTGSAGWVGTIAFLRLAPAIALSGWGGTLSDRFGSLALLRPCHLGNAVLLAALAALTPFITIEGVATAVIVLGMLQAIAAAPIKSAVIDVIANPLIPAAIPLNAALFHLAAFLGPAIAGVAISFGGVGFALLLAAVAHGAFVLVLGRLSQNAKPTQRHIQQAVSGSGLHPAIRQCLVDPLLAPVLGLHLTAALLLRPFLDLMPAIVGQAAFDGPQRLAVLSSSAGVGALIGASILVLRPASARLIARMMVATAIAALALIAFATLGAAHPFAPITAIVFGAALVTRATASLTLVQLAAPSALKGRIAGLYSALLRGGTALGALCIGGLGSRYGLPLTLGLAGTSLFGALLLLRPAFTRITTDHTRVS